MLVEGFGEDAVAVAQVLLRSGERVRVAGAGAASPAARTLVRDGAELVEHVDLDVASAGVLDASTAFLDVWTPAVAPRVVRLVAQGTRVSSIGDLVLERSPAPVIGVTGTAGKTTTAGLLTHLLRTAGRDVLASAASASANRWPDAAILRGLEGLDPGATVVVELTSSHLAFMARSPQVAVVTTFWPDHVELHGSLEAYRRAKETIVRHQGPADLVVDATGLNAPFAGLSRARRPDAATTARLAGDHVVLPDGTRVALPAAGCFRGRRAGNVVVACTVALSLDVPPDAVVEALATARAEPFRANVVAGPGGIEVVDDGMAATPAKALVTLEGYGDRSLVLVCGGDDRPAWGAVHASGDEQAALERALAEAARVARHVVAFGPAGRRIEVALAARGVAVLHVATVGEAVEPALERTDGSIPLVFAPMFPVSAAERDQFAGFFRRRS